MKTNCIEKKTTLKKEDVKIAKTNVRKKAGKKAQKNGMRFEKKVSALCASYGFNQISYKEYIQDEYYRSEKRLIISQPVNGDFFRGEKKGRQDFLLRAINPRVTKEFRKDTFEILPNNKKLLEICIQCKSQKVSGSVDEKIGSFLLNLEHDKIEQQNVIFLFNGEGIRDCFINKLKEEINNLKNNNGYNFRVMNFKEFSTLIKKLKR